MPMDHTQSHDPYYDRVLGTELKFVWFPKTCYLSGKRIWLKKAYRLIRMYVGPGDPIFEYRWHDKNTHIMWMLKR